MILRFLLLHDFFPPSTGKYPHSFLLLPISPIANCNLALINNNQSFLVAAICFLDKNCPQNNSTCGRALAGCGACGIGRGLGASGRDGDTAHPGRMDALGEHLLPSLPSPWEPGGFVPRCRRVPGRCWRCCRCSSAATSRPKGDDERGGTAGIARRCCAGPGGTDGEPPPAFRHGIAISLRFWQWCLCLQGQPGSQPSRVLLLTRPTAFSPVSAVQWPHFFPQFVLSGYLDRSDPPTKECQQLGGTRPAAISRGELAASLWQSSSEEQGQDCSPFSPSVQFTAVPSSTGLPSQLWNAWLGPGHQSRVCHTPVPELLAGSQALARLWSCCWPAHSDSIALATSSCFLICIPVPPLCFGRRARTILCPCLLLLLWLLL